MENLVKIENNKEYGLVVSSRTIAEELGKEHKILLRDCRSCLKEGVEFVPSEYITIQNKKSVEYLVTKDGFILLMMNYQGYNDFKRAYINRFNEMEKALQNLATPSYQIADPIERAKRWIEEEQSRQKLLNENAELKPKADYHDKVLDTESCYTTTQIAKELEMSARQLNIMLNHLGVQYKQSGQWLLTKKYQDKGYVKTRTHLINDSKTKHSTVWTEKGREFLIDLAEDF